LGWKYT